MQRKDTRRRLMQQRRMYAQREDAHRRRLPVPPHATQVRCHTPIELFNNWLTRALILPVLTP
ncbi:hypothetical protein XJ28_13815 [Pseudomonas syringae pv. tomato]|nr:hypothetical protein XJ28_13815 [Pseudomonas syringae pv. tomato]